MTWVIGLVSVVVALPLLLYFVPPIEIPIEIFNVFMGSFFHNVINSVAFFIPVGFIFKCIMFLLSVRLFILIWPLIGKIINLLRGG